MSVKYSLAYLSSKPGDKTATKLYYAKAQADGEVTMDDMADDIAYATSLTDGDVLNVIRALIRQMNKNLANGKIVRLENLGCFQMQLCSDGVADKDKFTSSNITKARIQFRPGKMVAATTRTGSGGLSFQQVSPKKKSASTGSDSSNTGGNSGGGTIDDNPLG